jgi:hypothetical protein
VPVRSRRGDLDEHLIRARDWNRDAREAQHLRPACRCDDDRLLLLREAWLRHCEFSSGDALVTEPVIHG